MRWELREWQPGKLPVFQLAGVRLYFFSGPLGSVGGYSGVFISREALIDAFEELRERGEIASMEIDALRDVISGFDICRDFNEVMGRIIAAGRNEEITHPLDIHVQVNGAGQPQVTIKLNGDPLGEPILSLHRLMDVLGGQLTDSSTALSVWGLVHKAMRQGLHLKRPGDGAWSDHLNAIRSSDEQDADVLVPGDGGVLE